MEKRQKRQEKGNKKGVEWDDDDDDEWPSMPPGYHILTAEEQEEKRREESKFQLTEVNEQPTATDILQDMHMAANDNLLSSFPQESSEDNAEIEDIQESLLSAFEDSSNSPPPCPILVDTVPDDDILFPGNSC